MTASYPKSRLPGPCTRLFELELATHPDADAYPEDVSDNNETIRVSYDTTTLKANGAAQDILIERCRLIERVRRG